MLNDFIYNEIIKSLIYEPLDGQKELINKLSLFVSSSSSENELFLLKGYAGTGKTSAIAGLVKALKNLKLKTILMAPTGRAAKVLGAYSNKEAFTIHKKIYRQHSSNDGLGKFGLDTNLHTNTIFIVDEASMISNQSFENSIFGTGRLLDDLIKYVYNKQFCKLILIGDTAQLPPVKLDLSPALDKNELAVYGFEIIEHELTEVVRQKKDSGILFNATKIRNILAKNLPYTNVKYKGFPKIKLSGFNDIGQSLGSELIEEISDAYAKFSEKDVAIICRSNKRANQYNQGIRSSVLYKEEEISAGDLVMVVKNNYFWAEDYDSIDFIANGDIAEVLRIQKYTERYGYRFADLTLKFHDYKDIEIDVKIILDTLHSESASLSYKEIQRFYGKVEEDFLDIKNRKSRFKEIKKNPYFNALQIKFAYAITCHKAQGGQWKKVFIDQGWLTEDMINREFLRWLYTAITRASKELSLVNFKKEFFNVGKAFE